MATVINNPSSPTPVEQETNSWVGLVLMIFILFLLLYLGVPYIRSLNPYQGPADQTAPAQTQPTQTPAPTDAAAPTNTAGDTNDTTIMIPDRIDVNVNQTSPSPVPTNN